MYFPDRTFNNWKYNGQLRSQKKNDLSLLCLETRKSMGNGESLILLKCMPPAPTTSGFGMKLWWYFDPDLGSFLSLDFGELHLMSWIPSLPRSRRLIDLLHKIPVLSIQWNPSADLQTLDVWWLEVMKVVWKHDRVNWIARYCLYVNTYLQWTHIGITQHISNN